MCVHSLINQNIERFFHCLVTWKQNLYKVKMVFWHIMKINTLMFNNFDGNDAAAIGAVSLIKKK